MHNECKAFQAQVKPCCGDVIRPYDPPYNAEFFVCRQEINRRIKTVIPRPFQRENEMNSGHLFSIVWN